MIIKDKLAGIQSPARRISKT